MLEMKKPLILWAVLANILIFTPSTEQNRSVKPWSSSESETSEETSEEISKEYKKKPRHERCGRNEQWVNCPFAVCVPKTCDDVGLPVPCPDLLPNAPCPDGPGCICKENYVKNKGVCIPMKQCPSCGGDKNAFVGCGYNYCNRLCSNYNNTRLQTECPEECPYNSCTCKQDFVYDEIKNICVKPEECSKLKCNKKRNEVYDPCPPPCPLRTCGVDDEAVDCVPAVSPGHPDCAPPKCRCKEGFYRDDKGNCVTKDKCPTCSGVNEMYDPCPNPCPPQRCDVNPALILCLPAPPIGDPRCEPGCRCIDGYVRNYTGNVCINREDCPTCPQDEIYDICDRPCPPRRCDVDERLIKCAAPPKPGDPNCVEGCRCVDGYKRDYNGVCIPAEQCPSCGRDNNATSGCGVNCNKLCRDVGKKPGACIEICYENECDCKEGYYLDENTDLCVKPEDCSPVCPIGEIYSECIQSNCGPKKCSELGFPVRCAKINPKFCKKGCVCRDGKVRNSKGICVDRSECPSCGGDSNARSGCGVNCNRRCSDINQEPQVCIELCYDNACDCKDGYYFDEDCEKCVLPDDCPPPKCNKNEYFNNCSNSDCSPQNCNDLGFSIECADIGDPCQCTEDCLCKIGYVRNNKGICVPTTECPSCGGDPNAVSGCGGYCNQKCSSIGKEPEACILLCEINGCNCREGFYYDEIQKLCVAPEDCKTKNKEQKNNESNEDDLTEDHLESSPVSRRLIG